jgi:hypothetical protein
MNYSFRRLLGNFLLFLFLVGCSERQEKIEGSWSIIAIYNVNKNEINNGKPHLETIPIIFTDDLKRAFVSPYINDNYQIRLDFDFKESRVKIYSKEVTWWNGEYEFSRSLSDIQLEVLTFQEITSDENAKEIVLVR